MSTAFRPFDPFQVFIDQHGNLAVGGSLAFFTTGTTTPKDVFADIALTVNLGNSIGIGSDGRPEVGGSPTDIWGSGSYRVRLLDVNNVQIGPDRDNVEIPGGNAAALPTPFIPNAFLSNDGALAEWLSILQLPDPTGHANNILGTDGSVILWQTIASLNIPVITVAPNSYQIGKLLIQVGTGSAPANGTSFTTVSVPFPVAYASTPWVGITATGTGLNNTWVPPSMVTAMGTTSFTVLFDSNTGFPGLGLFTSVQPFSWIAIGLMP